MSAMEVKPWNGQGPVMGRTPFFSRLRVRLLALVLLAILPALGLVLYTGYEQRGEMTYFRVDIDDGDVASHETNLSNVLHA